MKKFTLLFLVCALIGAVSETRAAGFCSRWGGSFYPASYACQAASFNTEPVYYEAGELISLFNGTDLAGWVNAKGETPSSGWTVQDGAIYRAEDGAGSLFTEKKFDNFILEFEFKTAKGANSGVKYKLWKKEDDVLGCEYQILDPDANDHGALHETAALYDVFPPEGSKDLLIREDYNKAKIVVRGRHIEHWLNGVRVVSVLVNSPEWREHVSKSKFSKDPFGQATCSQIFLQDHGDSVWFRNITIRELKPIGR